MGAKKIDETRDGVELTNLDQPLFDGADATKRDLIDYLDAVSDRILPVLRDRPLSTIRVHRGHEGFMQKNVPQYTPSWVETTTLWAESSRREVTYALANDRRTLLWFANQRAVEYHPTLSRIPHLERVTHVVLDLDPPSHPSGRAGVVPHRVGRHRGRHARRLHDSHRRRAAGGPGSVGRAHARGPDVAGRPDRRGPRHPRGARGGHARRQAAGPQEGLRRSA